MWSGCLSASLLVIGNLFFFYILGCQVVPESMVRYVRLGSKVLRYFQFGFAPLISLGLLYMLFTALNLVPRF